MKIVVDENSEILKLEKTLQIDGRVLRKRDLIQFTCNNCGEEIQQKFDFRQKFLNLEFICKNCKREETNLKKYGKKYITQTDEFKKAKKETVELKYGVKNVFQSPEIKQKIRQTNLKKYDVEYAFQSSQIKQKIRQTNLEKYGVEYITQLEKFKEIRKTSVVKTNIRKYGVESHNQNNNIKNKKRITTHRKLFDTLFLDRLRGLVSPLFSFEEYEGTNYTKKYPWKCNTCGEEFYDDLYSGRIPRCPTCYPNLIGYSTQEKEVVEFLKDYTLEENNRNIIPPYELDIYLPDYKLAIEYNGVYWHSEEFLNKDYHQNKVKLCHQQGIRLLHIWEDEWLEDSNKVKARILYYINNLMEEIQPTNPKLVEKNGHKVWL